MVTTQPELIGFIRLEVAPNRLFASDKLRVVDTFLREYLPDGFAIFTEIVTWVLAMYIWGRLGEKLAQVTEQDVYNRRHERLMEALTSLFLK